MKKQIMFKHNPTRARKAQHYRLLGLQDPQQPVTADYKHSDFRESLTTTGDHQNSPLTDQRQRSPEEDRRQNTTYSPLQDYRERNLTELRRAGLEDYRYCRPDYNGVGNQDDSNNGFSQTGGAAEDLEVVQTLLSFSQHDMRWSNSNGATREWVTSGVGGNPATLVELPPSPPVSQGSVSPNHPLDSDLEETCDPIHYSKKILRDASDFSKILMSQTPPHTPCTPPRSPSPALSSMDGSRASTPGSMSGVPVSVIVKADSVRQHQGRVHPNGRPATLAERKMYDNDDIKYQGNYSMDWNMGSATDNYHRENDADWLVKREEELSCSSMDTTFHGSQQLTPPRSVNNAQEQIFVHSKDTDREEAGQSSLTYPVSNYCYTVPVKLPLSEAASKNTSPGTKPLQAYGSSNTKLVAIAPKMPSVIPVSSGTPLILAQINGTPAMIPTTAASGVTHFIVATPSGNGGTAQVSQVLSPILVSAPPSQAPQEDRKRAFKCTSEGCDKTYYKSSHLKSHMRSHTGEKPYHCSWPDCERRFARSDELSRHKRTHTGEKKFECTSCNTKFMRSDHLAKHMKRHTRRRIGVPVAPKVSTLAPAFSFITVPTLPQ